jgi:hypothetical protein
VVLYQLIDQWHIRYLELAIIREDDEILLQGAGGAILPGEVHQLIVLVQGYQPLPLVRRHLDSQIQLKQ